ncbi:MAG TPA: L,D-transpeptidase family protein [Candidatus Eisenbacteria bacterium]|nr:L,D-transpeptidase family protein [Candidatus Eisenbacteria bacterium]
MKRARTVVRGCVVAVCVVAGAVVAHAAAYTEEDFFAKPNAVYTIPTPVNGGPITVIGETKMYRVKRGDTLMDLARLYSLGYNEIVEANPGLDPWVPPIGAVVLLPTEWVLPCCSYSGIIVNIPEMRLFYYKRGSQPGTTTVYTYPVGLGRDDWRTPTGSFRVNGKTVNPQWNIPESIRKEHIEERDDPRTFIPGGDPDNPLGKYRLELTLPMYRIHGTNIPWGVGMQVSHGCVRLYPEDIERLFPTVPIGTPGEFTYQTIKIGRRGDVVFAEAHEDIYGHNPAIFREAMGLIDSHGFGGEIDKELLLDGLLNAGGIPFQISPGVEGASIASYDSQ